VPEKRAGGVVHGDGRLFALGDAEIEVSCRVGGNPAAASARQRGRESERSGGDVLDGRVLLRRRSRARACRAADEGTNATAKANLVVATPAGMRWF